MVQGYLAYKKPLIRNHDVMVWDIQVPERERDFLFENLLILNH